MSFFPTDWPASNLALAAQLAAASYPDGIKPSGWSKVKLGNLQITGGSKSDDGYTFLSTNDWFVNSAAASVFESTINGKRTVVISFRGTDTDSKLNQVKDFLDYPNIFKSSGLADLFSDLLEGVFRTYKGNVNYVFTGHSLGAAVVNQLSAYKSKYGDFSKAEYYAFASPLLKNTNVLNFGFDNDVIYGLGSVISTKTSNDHTMIVNSQNDAFITSKPNTGSHDKFKYFSAVNDISRSSFVKEMKYDDYVFYINTSGNIDISDKFSLFTKVIYIIGSDIGERVTGTFLSDNFSTLGGNDIIHSSLGRDRIYSGSGNDIIYGEGGADTIYGEGDNDIISGGSDADKLYGGAGSDIFRFVVGDVVSGEIISGGSVKGENNRISGNGSIDFQIANISAINEITFEKAGAFTFSNRQISEGGINPRSLVFASSGADQLTFNVGTSTEGAQIDLSSLRFDTKLQWSTADKILIHGNAKADTIIGTTRNDIIFGGAGSDTLKAGKGNDIFRFRPGDLADKLIDGGATSEQNAISGQGRLTFSSTVLKAINGILFEAAGRFQFDAIQISATGLSANSIVIGSRSLDELLFTVGTADKAGYINLSKLSLNLWDATDKIYVIGNASRDTIFGSNRADVITGGGGDDNITGGLGRDSLWGGLGNDTFRFATSEIVAGEVINGGSLANGEKNTLSTRGNVDFSTATVSFVNNLLFESAGSVTMLSSQLGDASKTAFKITGSTGVDRFTLILNAPSAKDFTFNQSLFEFYNATAHDKISIIGSAGNDSFSLAYGANATVNMGKGNDYISLNSTHSEYIYRIGDGHDFIAGGDLARFNFGTIFKDYLDLRSHASWDSSNVARPGLPAHYSGILLKLGSGSLFVESGFWRPEIEYHFTPENTGLKYVAPIGKEIEKFVLAEGGTRKMALPISNLNANADYEIRFDGASNISFDKATATVIFDANFSSDIRAGTKWEFEGTFTVFDGFGWSDPAAFAFDVLGERQTHEPSAILDRTFGAANVVTTITESQLREGGWINIADLLTPDDVGVNASVGYQGLSIEVYDTPGDEPIKFSAIFSGVFVGQRNDLPSSYDFTSESYYKFRVYSSYNDEFHANAGLIGHDFTIRIVDDLA